MGGTANAGSFPVDICGKSSRAVGDGLSSTTSSSRLVAQAATSCPGGLGIYSNGGAVAKGASAGFKVTAPSGIVINGIHVVEAGSANVGTGKGW